MSLIKHYEIWLRFPVFCGFLLSSLLASIVSARDLTVPRPQTSTPMQIIHPADEDKDDGRFADIKEILTMALEKTKSEFGPSELKSSLNFMNGRRARASLDSGELTIIWTSTSVEKEKSLRPIRIPIRKGILGYRVLLINADQH